MSADKFYPKTAYFQAVFIDVNEFAINRGWINLDRLMDRDKVLKKFIRIVGDVWNH